MTRKSSPTWSDVKRRLAAFDHPALIALVHDLYDAGKENRAFLHSRFALGGDVLAPYKAIVERWLSPDVYKNQDTSVAKAKKAIADYKKAVGQTDGLAELMVFFCEHAAGFSVEVGMDDEDYLGALLRMFGEAQKLIRDLPEESQTDLMARLDEVQLVSSNIGYGVPEKMGELLDAHGSASAIR